MSLVNISENIIKVDEYLKSIGFIDQEQYYGRRSGGNICLTSYEKNIGQSKVIASLSLNCLVLNYYNTFYARIYRDKYREYNLPNCNRTQITSDIRRICDAWGGENKININMLTEECSIDKVIEKLNESIIEQTIEKKINKLNSVLSVINMRLQTNEE